MSIYECISTANLRREMNSLSWKEVISSEYLSSQSSLSISMRNANDQFKNTILFKQINTIASLIYRCIGGLFAWHFMIFVVEFCQKSAFTYESIFIYMRANASLFAYTHNKYWWSTRMMYADSGFRGGFFSIPLRMATW